MISPLAGRLRPDAELVILRENHDSTGNLAEGIAATPLGGPGEVPFLHPEVRNAGTLSLCDVSSRRTLPAVTGSHPYA